MNFKNIPAGKKLILALLLVVFIGTFLFLAYGLVYASTESLYKKNAFIIGLFFLVIGKLTISFYKSAINKHPA